ncbi:MAG TPA: multicopper oxidase family protein [Candidatus Cybelea sp.]|jgi:FtsP/CotA-like multicopper oxidase with cupredoxin domain
MRRLSFLSVAGGALAAASLPRLSERALALDSLDVVIKSAPAPSSLIRAGRGTQPYEQLLAFNGSIPGPLLRVVHGQRIRVSYASLVDVPTSIHWHGMILPNDMDGVAGLTQPAIRKGETYVYSFTPGPPGTRWYHDHGFGFAFSRGLFGMFVVEDPNDEPADREFALIFHETPRPGAIEAARRGVSTAAMNEPMGSGEMQQPSSGAMGDEVAYAAYLVNGAAFPYGQRLAVAVGDRVRLRLLNASATATRYIALTGHELAVTHADGNPLARPVTVDVLRLGAGERYDALAQIRVPGAFLIQAVSSDPLQAAQAVLIYTEGMENAPPQPAATMLDGLRVFSYELAGGAPSAQTGAASAPLYDFTLDGGGFGKGRWTIDGKVWPKTPKLHVRRDQLVTVRFRNTSDMDHPMHLHGHVFSLTDINGKPLQRPLAKDVVLVPAGGSTTLSFLADSPPGRWLLHCHNEVHMIDGMMMEIVYASDDREPRPASGIPQTLPPHLARHLDRIGDGSPAG